MTDRITARRAQKARLRDARRAAQSLDRERVRFDVEVRAPGTAEPTRTTTANTRALMFALRELTRRTVFLAARGETPDGTAITVTAKAPRRTGAQGITWDPLHLCQLLYSGGRWHTSDNGRDWQPVEVPDATR